MAESSHHLGQQIVAAESDGVIRQKQPDAQAVEEFFNRLRVRLLLPDDAVAFCRHDLLAEVM